MAEDSRLPERAEKDVGSEDERLATMETMEVDEDKQDHKKIKPPLDNNVYSTKKTVAQGMMDLALLTSNASQLQLVLKYKISSPIFVIHVSCLCISIVLQILVGVLLILLSRYNINKPSHQSRADLLNNLTVVGIFLVTVSNVLASSFSDAK